MKKPAALMPARVQASTVALDCSDGEVARLKFQTSRFGSQLDVAADNIINVAVFAAIAKAAAGRLGSRLALTLGALSVIGVAMCVLVVLLMVWLTGLQDKRDRRGTPAE